MTEENDNTVPANASPLIGRWNIVEMEMWDSDAFNLVTQAHIEFLPRDDRGHFQFICVEGYMDCKYGEESGRPYVEWSWHGSDEMDPVNGRGWAVLEEDGKLRGKIYIQQGDNSEFVAERA